MNERSRRVPFYARLWMEPKKIQRYLEMTSNERVAACFGLLPTGTNEKVRGKESSTLNSTYGLCYGKNYVVLFF